MNDVYSRSKYNYITYIFLLCHKLFAARVLIFGQRPNTNSWGILLTKFVTCLRKEEQLAINSLLITRSV